MANNEKKQVAIIMGSASDWNVMKFAKAVLEEFEISYDVDVVSAHRTPDRMMKFAKGAEAKYSIIIAGAGGAAHLPGMVASWTLLPVIGVPIKSKFSGTDSIHSILSMPYGTPVATVGVDSARNAALLAVRILGINSASLKTKMVEFHKDFVKKVDKSVELLHK